MPSHFNMEHLVAANDGHSDGSNESAEGHNIRVNLFLSLKIQKV